MPENVHDDGAGPVPEPADQSPADQADGAEGADAGPVGEHFAEAVAMLARLPLTDAERADAVRRMLAGTHEDNRDETGAT